MKPPPERDARQLLARWTRRAITIPGLLVLTAVYLLALPFLLLLGVVTDVIRRGRSTATRAFLFGACYLAIELAGLASLLLTWLFVRLTGHSRERERWWTYRIELGHARAIYGSLSWLFRMKTEVEGGECLAPGPLILFTRHVSQGDAFLPAVVASGRYGLWLRFVLKQELQMVPVLDFLGHRLPNHFVHRESRDSAGEIAAIQALLEELGDRDAVIIYPEGTRFTPAKRERVLAKLAAAKDERLLREARALNHVLPPRFGGPLGLVEAGPGIDVVFLAHTGFEGINSIFDLGNGRLLDGTIHALFWRVPAPDIPPDRRAKEDWLYGQWRRMDAWIDRRIASGAGEEA